MRFRSTIGRVGPLPVELVWALILLLDVAIILGALTALTWIGDHVEDVLWPGGTEWVPF